MNDFQNKVAVITGAAGGLGREMAHVGARLGMRLVLADVQQDALEKTRSELAAQQAQVIAVDCDVSKAEQVRALAQAALRAYGTVHLLFNNAGVGSCGLVWENTEADWEWVLGVNLWGAIHGVRIFTPLMLECAKKEAQYQGHIVNTASVAGLINTPLLAVYNVSKHAVVSLSESLYQDLKLVQAQIGVSVLCPYFMPTGIGRSERNRPDALRTPAPLTTSQAIAQTMVEQAVMAGSVSARNAAELTFDAIRHNRFYIHPQPEILDQVQTRMQDILAARNPADPYDERPQVRQMLRAKLK